MRLNIDTEENLEKCIYVGEHDFTTNHILDECPTYGDGED